MAYNNRNLYLRIKDIQDLFLQYKTEENTTRFVYRKYIYPTYKISIATFYNYMNQNVRKELRQLNLFNDENSLLPKNDN